MGLNDDVAMLAMMNQQFKAMISIVVIGIIGRQRHALVPDDDSPVCDSLLCVEGLVRANLVEAMKGFLR